MSEIIVNYTSIEDAISDLKLLQKRIQKYSGKTYYMEESKGTAAQALLATGNSFTRVAKGLEEYISDTIKDISYASETFEKTDKGIAKKFK